MCVNGSEMKCCGLNISLPFIRQQLNTRLLTFLVRAAAPRQVGWNQAQYYSHLIIFIFHQDDSLKVRLGGLVL